MRHAEPVLTGAERGLADSCAGLFRSVICGPGGTLTDAFDSLSRPPWRDCAISDPQFGLLHAVVAVPGEEPGNSWRMLSLRDEVFVVITQCSYTRVRSEVVPAEPFIEFHLTINGETTLSIDPDEISVHQASMLICRQGRADYTVYCTPGPRCLISIYARPHFIRELMTVGGAVPEPARRLFAEHPAEMTVQQQPIRFDVQAATRQLLENEFTGMRRLHFSAAKVMELLCLCARDLMAPPSSDMVSVTFTDRDLKMFDQAREILATQFVPQPTILSLARAVGTNTSKLKAGFKAIYGRTIFEFGHHHRMMHALQLLASRRLPVGDVARQVGYHSQASFSLAFKDFFGQLPRDVRRSGGV